MLSNVVCCILQLAKNTTPMYRAPEMLDLYQNYPINEQSDIWVSFGRVIVYSLAASASGEYAAFVRLCLRFPSTFFLDRMLRGTSVMRILLCSLQMCEF